MCLDAESMWFDLDQVFERYEERLSGNPTAAWEFDYRIRKNRRDEAGKPEGTAADKWREFLEARRAEDNW
jgi:hypothetical protein